MDGQTRVKKNRRPATVKGEEASGWRVSNPHLQRVASRGGLYRV